MGDDKTTITLGVPARQGGWVLANQPARVKALEGNEIVIEHERADGSIGLISIPIVLITPWLIGRVPPMLENGYTVDGRMGPYALAETAQAVARGRGEWNGDGQVHTAKYVKWTTPDGKVYGRQVLGTEAVEFDLSEPNQGAVNAILSALPEAQRKIMEAALARR